MKAVVMLGFGGVDQLSYKDVDTPEPGEGEVQVKVAATSINPIDYKIRSGATRGRIEVELPAILGHDLVGSVTKLGRGVTGFNIGQRVMALANGTYAEFAVAKADVLALVPDALSDEEAAALPLVTLTGAQLIERAVKPKAGQAVLITGAMGSVGRSAVHVAMQHGAQVIAGVKAEQIPDAEYLGTLGIVALDDEENLAKFKDLDAIADTVGGVVAARLLKHLRPGGRFGSVLGVPKEAAHYDIHAEAILAKPDASRLYELADDAARKQFKIPIAKTMKLSEIREAHRLAEQGRVGGKIILVP